MQDNTNPQNQTNPVVGPPPDIRPTVPTEIPPVPPSPPRRRALIPTILGLVLLVVGVGAGLLLVQQQQIFRQKAGAPNNCCGVDRTCTTDAQWQAGYYACQRGECGCSGGTIPGGATRPAGCQVQGAPCQIVECNDGSKFGPDTCPGATSSNPAGSFASCGDWQKAACSSHQGVKGTTTGGTTTTGGATCPSGYSYCGGSIKGCMPTDKKTCNDWLTSTPIQSCEANNPLPQIPRERCFNGGCPGLTAATCNSDSKSYSYTCEDIADQCVPSSTTTTGIGGTTGSTTNRCPSGYIYCSGLGCISPTITCNDLRSQIDNKQPVTSIATCPDKTTCNQSSGLTTGSIVCLSQINGALLRCCFGNKEPVAGGYCPGFEPSPTSSTGGITATTCGGSGQPCCNPFTSGGKICNSNLYCNTTNYTCQQNAPSNLCQGGSRGIPGAKCKVYTCGSQCNLGNQCNLGEVTVDCTQAEQTLGNQCGQIDWLDTNNNYCGVKSQNCGGSCAGGSQPSSSQTQTPSTTTPTISASCSNIKAYDTSWNLLTTTQLSQLKSGDKVRFTVTGTTTSGVFDKARFTVNGTVRPEVATVKPAGNQEFYDEYTIPDGVTSFTVTAEIHHQGLNTWN